MERIKLFLRSEIEPELVSTWLRISLGLAYLIFCIYNFTVCRQVSLNIVIQLCAIAALFSYSFWYSAFYKRIRTTAAIIFVFNFFDIAIVTILLASFSLNHQILMYPFRSVFFCAYLIVIFFNTLYSCSYFAVFSGVICFTGYTIVFFFSPYYSVLAGGILQYWARVALIVSVTFIAVVVTKRNYLIKNKAISSELRYQKLVNRLPEMLFILDANGIIIWSNKASFGLLGVPAEVMPNRVLKDFMTSPDQLRLDKGEYRATFQIKDFGGSLKYVDCYLQPLKEDGKQNLFEGILTDVTDREIAVFQREEMINRLYQYQKMESLGTLATGMAHDFNNILQTVNDMIYQVENETSEKETKKRMNIISESLIDAKFLISELLALGRKRPLDYKPVNILPFFESIIPQFQDQLGQRYTIISRMPGHALWIQGDADYFKRIFQNLIGNSRDAMPDGGNIIIECFEQKIPGKSGMVVIRVSDTGTGIPLKIKDKIFDPFFTTKKPGKGTGLGLALVQRIVSLHNGTIVVEKTDSSGTTFRIEIPKSRTEDTDMDTKEIMLNRRKTRVLILDDDPKIRSILKFFLAEFSYPVCEASDMEEGARELQKYVEECGLVIMDWKLGSDNPHNVINKLRGIKPELIVIVVSGYPPHQESIKTMNIFKWIIKPYDKNQLDLEIQRALYFYERKDSQVELS
jgi:PAS domain S-box-containing protein